MGHYLKKLNQAEALFGADEKETWSSNLVATWFKFIIFHTLLLFFQERRLLLASALVLRRTFEQAQHNVQN